MTKKYNNTRFKDNCQFIMTNLDITTDLLTDEQLDCWSVKDENDEQEQFDLFMFAYTMYTLRKQGHGQISLNIEELDTRFEIYKTIISLEKLSRKSQISYERRKIFDFEGYDTTIDIEIGNIDNQDIA